MAFLFKASTGALLGLIFITVIFSFYAQFDLGINFFLEQASERFNNLVHALPKRHKLHLNDLKMKNNLVKYTVIKFLNHFMLKKTIDSVYTFNGDFREISSETYFIHFCGLIYILEIEDATKL
jgi:hypothetical protein